jgi:tRNA (adenine22-N1)-methyltransferase
VDFIRPGKLLADVGTDHAYLPIYLCEQGVLTPVSLPDGSSLCAIASDVNQGPVDRAALHIRSAGCADRIHTIRTDGLQGLDTLCPQDIVLFGMGGDLMVSILDQAPWIRSEGTRLILQPMTHAETVRAYLLENGFAITGERFSSEQVGSVLHIYQTICADFDPSAAPTHTNSYERYIGAIPHDPEQRALYLRLAEKTRGIMQTRYDAKHKAGQATDKEEQLLAQLSECLSAL